MHAHGPHFLLYAEATRRGHGRPRWKFVLQSLAGDEQLAAADTEPEARPSRLELLAVVRGLEALDQPSRVTLLTRSRYISRGLRRELNHWRDHGWRWERFGQFVPIRDHDLWQRVDRALQFHQVECCAWHGDDSLEWVSTPTIEMDAAEREPALLVVPRRHAHRPRRWSLAGMLSKLQQGVLTPFSAICRPAFTRAA
jgi:ribonuclease HI